MKKFIKENWFKLIVFGVILYVVYAMYQFYYGFRTTYYICDKNFSNCSATAKFKDLQTCSLMTDKWSWHCDESDRENIKCSADGSSTVTSYCK